MPPSGTLTVVLTDVTAKLGSWMVMPSFEVTVLPELAELSPLGPVELLAAVWFVVLCEPEKVNV